MDLPDLVAKVKTDSLDIGGQDGPIPSLAKCRALLVCELGSSCFL